MNYIYSYPDIFFINTHKGKGAFMSNQIQRNQKELSETRERFKQLSGIAKQLRVKLEEERRDGSLTPDEIQQSIRLQSEKVNAIKNKLKRKKEMSKTRKEEMSSWQAWFDSIEEVNKATESNQLGNELSWRRDDIAHLEKEIGSLYHSLHQQELVLMEKKVQLEAINHGVLNKPVDEDPRLVGIMQEKEELQHKINELHTASS